MSESTQKAVLGSIVMWSQALGGPLKGAVLLALGLYYSGLADWLTPAWWVATAPLWYVLWLILTLGVWALEMQLLFRRYEKPRHTYAAKDAPEVAQHFRLLICYLRAYIVRGLPLTEVVCRFPLFGRLYYLSYAPSVSIGKDTFFAGFMYDPDLTDIGEYVVIGGSCVLSAHNMVMKGEGNFTYVSAGITIGDRVTIGGESRISMGVTIGHDSIVEAFSNVTAMTHIPPGEVWGGNPAVFLRKRADLEEVEVPPDEALDRRSAVESSSVDIATAARRVVDQALNLPASATEETAAAERAREFDSLMQLALAATLADAYGCRLSPPQIMALKSPADVERVIADSLRREPNPASADIRLPSDPEWLPLLPSDEATRLLSTTRLETSGTPLPIAVAAAFTAEPIASSLTTWSAAFGVPVQIEFCGYNQIAPALLSPDGPFRRNTSGLNVVLLRVEDLPDDPESAREAAGVLLAAIRSYAESPGAGTLVVGTLPPPLAGDYAGDRAAVDGLRVYWASELQSITGVRVLDFAGVVERIGVSAASDAAMELAARAPFSAAAYRELGIELARIVRSRRRPRAKVLALDCDNTLWGGVLGEDGFDGIQIGPDGPGRSFQTFQRALLRLKAKGVLLTLVSRNEEADVLDVLDRHPGMLLRRTDFAGRRIDWRPKSDGLRALAADLNLGLDAFVFVDDDPAQRLHVETLLPSVHVFPTPNDATQFAAALRKLWIFDAERLTAEDLSRTEMMQQEAARKHAQDAVADLETYLAGLELQVEFREACDADLPRVAQLTQKTNQFNLSLRRRTPEEIKALDAGHRIFVLTARDRFGDYGQVGCCIVRHDAQSPDKLEIDTFLLSCRALGRGIEGAFLYGVAEAARRCDATILSAPFVPGPRNQPARDFFVRSGFCEQPDCCYTVDSTVAAEPPKHVRMRIELRDAGATVPV